MPQFQLHCHRCDYSLSGLLAVGDQIRCPECGEIAAHVVPKNCDTRCSHCQQTLFGQPIFKGRAWCDHCGGTTHIRDGKPAELGLIPNTCPKCAYSLMGITSGSDCVRCPECGVEIPTTVPDMPWPLRCRKCREDLTDQWITGGRVRCPTCNRTTAWPLAMIRGEVERKLAFAGSRGLLMAVIGTFALLVLFVAVAYVLFSGP